MWILRRQLQRAASLWDAPNVRKTLTGRSLNDASPTTYLIDT